METDKKTLHVLSFNIRYDTFFDFSNRWKNRKDLAINFIHELNKSTTLSLIGFQEVLPNQLEDLKAGLSNDYEFVSTGREPNNAGEHNTVCYKKDQFSKCLESGTFWLSETPNQPSKNWGSACYRICTFVKLQFKEDSPKTLLYLNTHWDHWSGRAQKNSAKLVKDFIVKKITEDSNIIGVILSGDFNVQVTNDAFKDLIAPQQGDITMQLINSYEYCKENQLPVNGPEGTFTGFAETTRVERIDHILFTANSSVKPLEYTCHSNVVGEEKKSFITDHRPIQVKFEIDIN
ncbi:hypothetical protein ABK040_009383 [Willaertia magna]